MLVLVAPARERGLKSHVIIFLESEVSGRSREGAWIEMMMNINPVTQTSVAPARERGLKFFVSCPVNR